MPRPGLPKQKESSEGCTEEEEVHRSQWMINCIEKEKNRKEKAMPPCGESPPWMGDFNLLHGFVSSSVVGRQK